MPTPSLADTAASPFQHGTQVEVRTSAGWAPATIIKRNGRKVLPEYGHGYERVRFADGREMAVCDFRAPTNMPWAVYRCDLLGRGNTPKSEVFVSGHLTPSEAMDEANRLKRGDRQHSYTVGAA